MWKRLTGLKDWALDSVPNLLVSAVTVAAATYLAAHFDEVCEIAALRSRAFGSAIAASVALGVFAAFMVGGVEAYVDGKREDKRHEHEMEAEAARHEHEMELEAARLKRETEAEEAARKAAEAAAERERAEDARRLVLALEPWLKVYLRSIRENGGSIETGSVSDRMFEDELYPVGRLLETTRVSGDGDEHVWRVSLNDYGNYVVDECRDLLDEAFEHVKRREEEE